MISVAEAEQIQRILIEWFGGSPGVRDYAALSSALARPFQTFDQVELYPSIFQKIAAL